MGHEATVVVMFAAVCLLPVASHAREVVEDTVTGAIAGGAGKGAAASAVGGALFGEMRHNR